MSTKNLARTLIEGGRSRWNKSERSTSHREERALTRAYLTRALQQRGELDEVIGRRSKVFKDFRDKLGPPRRWLRSRAGRPWNKVRAEMFERFDPRSLAGQHILFGHLLQEVQMSGDDHLRGSWQYRFFVDAHGILRELPVRRRKPPGSTRRKRPREEEVEAG